ncbi:MAG: DUF4340 domain-containing protein [Longimicrobiales bacterium]|nr:DUF4340 domain-containing protein [Longimicrobiales bacterium]
MTERVLKQLVGAFAVMVAIWVLTNLVEPGSGSIEAPGEVTGLFDGLGTGELESASFVYRGEEVALTREPGGWQVNGYPADPVMIARFSDALRDLQVGDLTASNPANHARMGVSVDSAVAVTMTAHGTDRTFLLGHAGRQFGSAYLRLPDRDDVYLLDADLRGHATRSEDAWRDRSMAAVDTTTVHAIEVAGTAAGYTLLRRDSTWVLSSGGDADTDAVQGILSELANLMATGFLSEGDSIANLPEATVTIARSADGEALATVTLGEGEGDRWARTALEDFLYSVSSFRADRLAPSRANVTPGS